MQAVPHRWRNHINPWMTRSEIKRSVAAAERLYATFLSPAAARAFSREEEPDRVWPAGGDVLRTIEPEEEAPALCAKQSVLYVTSLELEDIRRSRKDGT